MGKAMQVVFGGSRQKSDNQAYKDIKSAFAPLLGQAQEATNRIGSFLSGDNSGFEAFKRAIGFDALAERGSRGVTNNAAAGGLLRSGSSGMALQRYGQDIQNQSAMDYLSQLFNMGNIGFNAGQTLTGAGSRSVGSSTGGLSGFIGNLMGGAGKAAAGGG